VGNRSQHALDTLRGQFAERPFRVSEAIGAGVSRTVLHHLRAAGALTTVSRGVLQLPDAGTGMLSELAAVSARAPNGSICLNSALAFWDLTDEIPDEIHLAVPRGAHRPRIRQPATKIHVFAADTFDLGRQSATTDAEEPFWVTSPERSVVDAIRMSHQIGRDVALHALRRYVTRPGASPAQLAEIAAEIGGNTQLRPALEAILS
jgi:predicted transcriptional regulator of viral defense system